MGRWTYYSPIFLAIAFTLVMNQSIREMVATRPAAVQWSLVALVALLMALAWQLAFVGAQGLFAQVLPVPGGRSVRGPGAVTTGVLLIVGVVLSGTAGLLVAQEAGRVAWIIGLAGAAGLAAAAVSYFWTLPTAERDFAAER